MNKKPFEVLVLVSTLIATFVLVPRMASQSPTQYGPKLDLKRWRVVKNADWRLFAMLTGEADVCKQLWRPSDIETLYMDGFTITSTPGFHICHITFNMRRWYFGPQNGSNPGQALRHAIAHLVDKDGIIGPMKKYTASVLDTVVPPAMREWHNPIVDPHPYNLTGLTMGEGIQVLYVPPAGVMPYAGGSDPGVAYRYNGTTWEVISPDLGKAVLSLVEFSGDLYAGVMSYGGVGRVYRHNGTHWILVGDDLDDQVSSLLVWNGELYAGTVPDARLLRYNVTSPSNWTTVLSEVLPNGIRSMYVWEKDNALYLGDFNSDRIVRYDGVQNQTVLDMGRSCIWDFQSYGGDLYASAWRGYVYRTSDGFSWTEVADLEDPERRNIWGLEVFQGYLYLGMDWMGNGTHVARLWRYDGISKEEVWTTSVTFQAEGIISMTNSSSSLFIGLGGEEGYYGSMGTGRVYSYDGLAFHLISEVGPSISAAEILLEAGWWWDGVGWRAPDGTPLPTIEFLSPTYEVDPQKAEIAAIIVNEMQSLTLPDGTPAPLPVVHVPVDLCLLDDIVLQYQDYDMAILNLNTGKHPDYLYDYFHSSQDFPWGHNSAGINNTELDGKLETIMSSLDHDEKRIACHEVQLELMGDPAYTYTNVTDGLLPWVPIYSKVIFDAFNPYLTGIVMSPGFGAAHNWWTEQDLHWLPGYEKIDPITGYTYATWILNDEPCSLNPLVPENPYGWQILSEIYDPNIMQNPYSHEDKPWIAESWTVEGPITTSITLDSEDRYRGLPSGTTVNIIDGMKITFILNDTVTWQDGQVYDGHDVEFNLEFLRNNQIPRYTSMWENVADVQVDPIDPCKVVVYSYVTSQFLLYDFAGDAALLPPQVWASWDGRPMAEILGRDPSIEEGPQTDPALPYYCPTNLYGTGAFIFVYYDPVGMVADLYANRDYWQTTDEIHDELVEMFHEIGDVDRNGEIWTIDKAWVALLYGCKIGDPCYDPDADLNSDGIINCVDLSIVEYYYGSCHMSVPLPPRFDSAIVSVMARVIPPHEEIVNIYVTVENQGLDPLRVDVSVYYDSNLIETQGPINLGLGRDTLTFTWNTTSIPDGSYTVTAIDTTGNTYIDGKVEVIDGNATVILGDITGPEGVPDGTVDIYDLAFIGKGYGKKEGDPKWDEYRIADLTGPDGLPDEIVDIYDLAMCGKNYGKDP